MIAKLLALLLLGLGGLFALRQPGPALDAAPVYRDGVWTLDGQVQQVERGRALFGRRADWLVVRYGPELAHSLWLVVGVEDDVQGYHSFIDGSPARAQLPRLAGQTIRLYLPARVSTPDGVDWAACPPSEALYCALARRLEYGSPEGAATVDESESLSAYLVRRGALLHNAPVLAWRVRAPFAGYFPGGLLP